MEYEKLFKKFQDETVEFETYKEREVSHIGELKEKELKKFVQEKRVSERQNKAIQNISCKKEKEEIETLKKETTKIQDAFKGKESRYKALIDKAKRELDETLAKNKELEEIASDLKKQINELKEENGVLRGDTKETPQLKNTSNCKPSHNTESYKDQDSDIGNEYDNDEQNNDEYDNSDKEDNEPAEEEKNLNNDNDKYEMIFLSKYHSKDIKLVSQKVYPDGKIAKYYDNGKTELIFTNGVRKETFEDSYTVIYFNNRDIKQVYPDGKTVYYFSEAKTTQTTFNDGLQVFKFTSGQLEKHYPDGTKEISFPDGTLKCIYVDGEEESIFTDGTVQRIEKNGVKAIEYSNGEKEISFPDGTLIKEYPDGRIKKVHPDGTCENTYAKHN